MSARFRLLTSISLFPLFNKAQLHTILDRKSCRSYVLAMIHDGPSRDTSALGDQQPGLVPGVIHPSNAVSPSAHGPRIFRISRMKRSTYPARTTLAALFWMLIAAIGCRHSPAPSSTRTLTLAVRADVTGFYPNPPTTSESYTIDVNRNIYDSLLQIDTRHRVEPALAERWENPDERTCLFFLRPGVRFSNGKPLTAADVAASFDALRMRGWISWDVLQAIESVRAVDDVRVEIKTRTPYLALLPRLTWGFILPAEAVGKTPVPFIGSGPYRLANWTPGKEFILEKNPYYRGPGPAFSRVRYVVVPDQDERIGMVLRGEAEVADNITPDTINLLSRMKNVTLMTRPALRVFFLCMRMDDPVFSIKQVREAIDLAMDRHELIRRVFKGGALPASQIVSSDIFGYNPDIQESPPDRQKARKLLAAAGFPHGFVVRLDGPFNRYLNDRQVLDEVARQLGEVGISVTVNAIDKRDFFQLIDSGKSPFHLLGWACETGDASHVLDAVFHSPAIGGLGSYNCMGIHDARLDQMIDESNRSTNNKERAGYLKEAIARVTELRLAIPLIVPIDAIVVSRSIVWDPPVNLALRPAEMRPAQ